MTEKAKKQKKSQKQGIKIEVEIPEGVEASLEGRNFRVKGPNGELTKKIQSGLISAKVEGNKISISTSRDRKKQRALINTEKGCLTNMIRGVKDGITYRLKIVYSHFPMSVKVQGSTLLVDNFLGEKHSRKAVLLDGVKLDVKGQDVTVSGIDKEKVAQTAANIEQTTKIKNLDPRVFQDGIYIVEKDGKPIK